MFDEEYHEAYNQWANEELIWGRGQFNWCRAYSKDQWEKQKSFKDDFNYDVKIPF